MAYIPVAKRGLKMIECSFISKDINITKMVREDRIERFRVDVLAKYGKLWIKYPHILKTNYLVTSDYVANLKRVE